MELIVATKKRCEMVDITAEVQRACKGWGGTGLVSILCPHTTAAVTLTESFDPTVKADILATLERLVPLKGGYAHAEGNSDAHIKSAIVGANVVLPVVKGKARMGRWQGLYLCEFDGPRQRTLWLTFMAGS